MMILRHPLAAALIDDERLRKLIELRFEELAGEEPFDPDVLGYFVVMQQCDSLDNLHEQIGLSLLENRYDGSRFGDENFQPSFEVIEEHACCYEIVIVLSDDGSGVLVFVPKTFRIPPLLEALCQRYAIPSSAATQ